MNIQGDLSTVMRALHHKTVAFFLWQSSNLNSLEHKMRVVFLFGGTPCDGWPCLLEWAASKRQWRWRDSFVCPMGKTGCLNTFNPLNSCSEKNVAVIHYPKEFLLLLWIFHVASRWGCRASDCVFSGFPGCVINQCYENRTTHASLSCCCSCCFSYHPSPETNSIKQ